MKLCNCGCVNCEDGRHKICEFTCSGDLYTDYLEDCEFAWGAERDKELAKL